MSKSLTLLGLHSLIAEAVRGRWIALAVFALPSHQVDERLLLVPGISLNQVFLLLLVPYLVRSVRRREHELLPDFTIFAIVSGALFSVSYLWSPAVNSGWEKIVSWWIAAAAVWVWVAGLPKCRDRALVSLLPLAAIGVILGGIGLAVYAASGWSGRLAVLGGGPNVFSRWVGLAIIILGGFVIAGPRGRESVRGLFVVSVAGLFVSFILANSKGSMVGLIAAVCYFGIAGSRSFLSVPRIAVGLAAVLSAVVVVVMVEPGAFARFVISPLAAQSSGSYGARASYYAAALGTSLENPIIGVGAGGWASAVHSWNEGLYPHNVILELLAEYGIVLGGMLILLYVTLACRLWEVRGPTAASVVVRSILIFVVAVSMFSGDLKDGRVVLLGLALLEWEARSSESKEARRVVPAL